MQIRYIAPNLRCNPVWGGNNEEQQILGARSSGGIKLVSLDLKRSEAHWDYIGLKRAKLSARSGFMVDEVCIWRHGFIGIQEISDVVHTRWWNSGKGIGQMISDKIIVWLVRMICKRRC